MSLAANVKSNKTINNDLKKSIIECCGLDFLNSCFVCDDRKRGLIVLWFDDLERATKASSSGALIAELLSRHLPMDYKEIVVGHDNRVLSSHQLN